MAQEQAVTAGPLPRRRLLTAGEWTIAPTILTIAVLLVGSTLSAVWWTRATNRSWHGGARPDEFSGIGVIAAGGLTLLWIAYRRLRARLSAVLAVHAALASAAAGEKVPARLMVNPELGPEAQAWNRLVADTDKFRRQAIADRARTILDRRHDVSADSNSVCDYLPQGIIVVDGQGRISFANGAAASFLRRGRNDLAGADFASTIAIDSVSTALRSAIAIPDRRRQIVDHQRADEQATAILRFHIRPLRREDAGSMMIVIEDITQQRCAEEARHQFVAQATHELRTPLTNIRLYIESAIDEGENDPVQRAKCLNIINSETRRLERIVTEMLSVAEIEAGSLKLRQDDVRLESLFKDLKDDYEQTASTKRLEMTFDMPPKLPVLKADRDKVLLALHNLVGNAVKYTPDGGRIECQAESSAQTMTIRVRDSGIGISEADAERVFDRFYRAKDPRVAKLVGSGIGLTLAREVVRLHGGDITVESRLNEGSTFTMTLPIAA